MELAKLVSSDTWFPVPSLQSWVSSTLLDADCWMLETVMHPGSAARSRSIFGACAEEPNSRDTCMPEFKGPFDFYILRAKRFSQKGKYFVFPLCGKGKSPWGKALR
jgi:hypothetical protein